MPPEKSKLFSLQTINYLLSCQNTLVFSQILQNSWYKNIHVPPSKLKNDHNVEYEKFHCPNTCRLSPSYSGLYSILNQPSDLNFEIYKPSLHFKRNSEIVPSFKFGYYTLLKILN